MPAIAALPTDVLPPLPVAIAPHVESALAGIGRTEDVRFSPAGRIVLAGLTRQVLLVLEAHVQATADGPRVTVDDFMEITSPAITRCHGVDFIDEQTIAVANRDGLVTIAAIPEGPLGGRRCEVPAIQQLRGGVFSRIKSPGSLVVRHERDGKVTVLVCNNYSRRVTAHTLNPRRGYRVVRNRLLLRRRLKLPDGIALSPDGRWIVVSSHNSHDVKVYPANERLNRRSEPVGVLHGLHFPHGLRFVAGGEDLLVCNAARPVIHVYHSDGGWAGEHMPVRTVRVLDEEAFLRGRVNEEEGGPKGIDLDPTGQVVAITCAEQTLAFYGLESFTGAGADNDGPLAAAGSLASAREGRGERLRGKG